MLYHMLLNIKLYTSNIIIANIEEWMQIKKCLTLEMCF